MLISSLVQFRAVFSDRAGGSAVLLRGAAGRREAAVPHQEGLSAPVRQVVWQYPHHRQTPHTHTHMASHSSWASQYPHHRQTPHSHTHTYTHTWLPTPVGQVNTHTTGRHHTHTHTHTHTHGFLLQFGRSIPAPQADITHTHSHSHAHTHTCTTSRHTTHIMPRPTLKMPPRASMIAARPRR